MRKIIVSEFVTLDGVAEEPGKWSFPFWNEEICLDFGTSACQAIND
jgi:hypothetical protein